MAFFLYTSIFVHNFYSGVNFSGKIAVILFCGNLFLQIVKNPQKSQKL